MPELILHQFKGSAFAEKALVALGIKKLSWYDVQIPHVMPKPLLMPLTGGYRRTPTLQIGADIYCDNRIIMRALEDYAPDPTLYPGGRVGMPYALSFWSDGPFFLASTTIVFANIGDKLPEAFFADREKMTGRNMRPEALKPLEPQARAQWRCFAGWIGDHLKDGKPFIMGDAPGLADINAYMNIKFVRSRTPAIAEELMFDIDFITPWADRMHAIGHGSPTTLSAEDALTIAKDTPSTAEPFCDPNDPQGLNIDDHVTVTPDDNAKVPVEGHVVIASQQEIAIRHKNETVGEVVVHFPRVGFIVTPI